MDRNETQYLGNEESNGRSLRGNVDRNMESVMRVKGEIDGRSLRGNVDRNTLGNNQQSSAYGVVPYVGTWIEI